jgi:sortase A
VPRTAAGAAGAGGASGADGAGGASGASGAAGDGEQARDEVPPATASLHVPPGREAPPERPPVAPPGEPAGKQARRGLRDDIRTPEGVTVVGKAAAEPRPAEPPAADAKDRVVAGLGADAPPARPDAGAYEEDPTEVLGPFDVGMWTLQGREAGPDPDKVRGRLAGRREARESRDQLAPQPDELALVTVGGGDDGSDGGDGGYSQDGPRDRGGDSPARGDQVRTVIRGIAQTMITLGLVLLLFAVYDVWFTGILNHRTQDKLKAQLETQWGQQGDDPVIAAQSKPKPGAKVREIPLGEGFALIYIPAFGTDYVYTIVEGTAAADLDKGPGHYPDTVLPGQIGNFSVAGHRVGKGSPFLNLDKLTVGSPIVIRTKTYWFTYRVLGDPATKDPNGTGPAGIPGMQIVSPGDIDVIDPVPNRPGAKPVRRLLTLTTCNPKFSARQRLIIHAQLDGLPLPTSKGLPPALKG